MKRYITAVVFFAMSIMAHTQNLYVGTYNVQNQNENDAKNGNGWARRSQVICDMMNFERPDILGAQEVKINMLHTLVNGMNGYGYVGVGRDDGKEGGEFCPILYNMETLDLEDDGNFWLCETPDTPKKGWDAANIRICTWGKFTRKGTSLTFYVFNLHMDYAGTTARRESTALVLKKIQELTGGSVPIILTGNFMVDKDDEIITTITASGLKDSYETAKQRYAENGTTNDFSSTSVTTKRTDYIFGSQKFAVENYGVLVYGYWTQDLVDKPDSGASTTYTRRLSSDHYPTMAKLSYGN